MPTIDQCYTYDVLCHWEAEQQIERDMYVFVESVLNQAQVINEMIIFSGKLITIYWLCYMIDLMNA